MAPTEVPLTPAKPPTAAKSQSPKSPVPAKSQTTPAKSQTTPAKPKSASLTDPIHTRTVAQSQAAKSRTVADPGVSETQGPGRFIKVEEPSAERTRIRRGQPACPLARKTGATVAALGAGYLDWPDPTQAPMADALYTRIEQTIDPADTTTLQEARDSLGQFLQLYPDDDRAATVRQYLDQADEVRAEKQQNLKNRQLNRASVGRSPVERAYREALFFKVPDPDQALLRFVALMDLYASTASSDEQQWIDLAKQEIEMLKNQLAASHAQDLAARSQRELAEGGERRASDYRWPPRFTRDRHLIRRQTLGRRAGGQGQVAVGTTGRGRWRWKSGRSPTCFAGLPHRL